MNKIDFKAHRINEVNKINNFSMVEVINKVSDVKAHAKFEFECPICGHKSCTILNDRMVTCWSTNCLHGSDVYNFIQTYFKKVKGITDFKEVYRSIDKVLGTSLFMDNKSIKEQHEPKNLFTKELSIDKYCSEKTTSIVDELRDKKRIIIDAKTGTGKTRLIAEVGQMLNEVDFVFLLTARRSIVEEIGVEYPYSTFVGNQTKFNIEWKPRYDENGNCVEVVSEENLIVATTHKARAINEELWRLECEQRKPFTYAVIIDECHLLHASRNIIGNINQLERLIENSKYSIFTSANTNHFYNASKEQYEINSYVSLERKHKINNLEKLEIVRLICNGTAKSKYMEGTILNQLEDNKKVLYINNNKAFNKELCETLEAYGIKAVHINAENKELEEYEDIIKRSMLSANVTICTSVIDTGVNIHSDNVTTIISCNNMTFDDISIIQGFARVRTTNGNRGILVLEEGKKDRDFKIQRIRPIEYYIKEYTGLVDELCLLFNTHMFENYDFTSYDEYNSIWDMVKENELYKGLNDCLKVICDKGFSNPRMIVDKVSVYEKARKHQLRESYYNNEFINNALKDIMSSELTWNEKTVKGEKIEKQKTEGDQEKYKEEIEFILNDKRSLDQLEKHYFYNTKVKDTEVLIDLLEIDKERTLELDKETKKIVKTCTKTQKGKQFFNYKAIIQKVYKNQFEENKKDRNMLNDKLTYTVYNNLYKEIEYNCENGLGDLLYLAIRETMDVVQKNKNKVAKKHFEICAREYVNKYLEIKGKEISMRTALNRVKRSFELMYNVSDKGYVSLNKEI